MTHPHRLRRLALGAAALLMAAAPAAAAFAQPYDRQDDDRYRQSQYEEQRRSYDAQYGDGSYDRYQADQQARAEDACREHKDDKAVGGALLGGIAGAVIGSNVARGGGREGGAIIGGLGGAAVGANVAKNSSHCDDGR